MVNAHGAHECFDSVTLAHASNAEQHSNEPWAAKKVATFGYWLCYGYYCACIDHLAEDHLTALSTYRFAGAL